MRKRKHHVPMFHGLLFSAFFALRAPATLGLPPPAFGLPNQSTGKYSTKLAVILKNEVFVGIQRAELSIRNDKEYFRCLITNANNEEAHLPWCRSTSELNLPQRGNYSFFVHIWKKEDKQPSVIGQQTHLQGDELEIMVNLSFNIIRPCSVDERGSRANASLELFEINIVRQTPKDVALRRDWIPSAEGVPRYIVENRGPSSWYGFTAMGNLFGRIEVFEKNKWKPYERGGKCGTDTSGLRLVPASSQESIEGYFLGSPSNFKPGVYRYILELSSEIPDFGYSCDFLDVGAPTVRTMTAYRLSDEFSIVDSRNQPRPPRSN